MHPRLKAFVVLGFLCLSCCGCATSSDSPVLPEIGDKTLVVWAAPANLDQRGGSALTLEQRGIFDAIVFGECAPGKWMAGSNNFLRTQPDQSGNAAETVGPDGLVQVAITYAGTHVTLYRDGQAYADYDVAEPQTFGQADGAGQGKYQERDECPAEKTTETGHPVLSDCRIRNGRV